jgi:glucose-6-phosphate 1-dehydrogenase
MNHCLVFGARGHLARTRIIPALKRMNCPYTPVSRQEVLDLHHLKDTKNLVAYMSIPTHNFCEAVEPYLEMVNPLYVLEKPHGHSKFDFERIKDFIHTNDLKVIYSDHYLGKDVLYNLWTPKELKSIKIFLHEDADMTERINYFDTVGIIGDMYQSHCVTLFATIIAKHTSRSRKEILRDLSFVQPQVTQLARNIHYKGIAPTQCKISMEYNGIILEADIAKMMLEKKKVITINGDRSWNLDAGWDAYGNVMCEIRQGKRTIFLDEEEVGYLWDHASIISG